MAWPAAGQITNKKLEFSFNKPFDVLLTPRNYQQWGRWLEDVGNYFQKEAVSTLLIIF